MENRRRIEAGVFPLPEVLIQRIQSFLDGKRAAQTSVLSKSWYSAWSTRPNLDFDQRDFRNQNRKGFWEFANKTMQRYEALNLRIQSFRLVGLFGLSSDFFPAKKLIVKAMRMGTIDFDFQLLNPYKTFTLPHEVLESETLIRLSVYGCTIDIRPDGKVCCGKLKSLFVNRVELKDDVICGLISSCPLIEKFSINALHSKTYELESRNLYKLYKLKSLYLGNVEVDTLFFNNLSANFPCLKDLTLEYCKVSSRSLECISFAQRNGVLRSNFDTRPDGKVCCGKLKSLFLIRGELKDDVICSLISSCPLIEKLTLIETLHSTTYELEFRNLYKLHKLKSLYLGYMDVDTLFFDNLSANFPCLKDLTLDNCIVSSRSLECISFAQRNGVLGTNFDVTSIRKLSLYFKTTSREWESHIIVGCYDFSNAWFINLKKLLTCLSFSKISLTLTISSHNENSSNYQLLPETAVENVTITVVLPSVCFTVLECLIWSFRPKSITLHMCFECGLPPHTCNLEKVKYDFLAILLQRNVEGAMEYCLMMNHELEKVDVEFFGEIVAERLPMKTHFRLGWRGGRG